MIIPWKSNYCKKKKKQTPDIKPSVLTGDMLINTLIYNVM